MNETKWLYATGMERHAELVEANHELTKLSEVLQGQIIGNEDYQEVLSGLGDGLKSLGSGLFTSAAWVTGKTVGIFAKALGGTGNLLVRAFADNDVLIKKLVQQFSKGDEHEIKFSKEKLALLTANGDADELSKDMDTLLRTLEQLDKHGKDLLTFLDKRMAVARKLKGVKTTEDLFAVIDENEKLEYPVPPLAHTSGDVSKSDTLPGGKVIEFDHKSFKYLMNGDAPESSGDSVTMSKSDVSSVLSKLDKVNSMHKRVKYTYDSYLSFIKTWGEMVKSVEENLSKLQRVSKSALNDAEKLLGGEPAALAFYSGFTPRVVSYTDRYIHGVLGVFV